MLLLGQSSDVDFGILPLCQSGDIIDFLDVCVGLLMSRLLVILSLILKT